ncbi:hypothetical protein [Microvirga sp. TS319]|uniref:hypothetical protein n=1 Tax=Microvirga sp. TS319 TaxID=3241165 RepID=UPI003519E569
MFDYIRMFEDEAAAIAACPDYGRINEAGTWEWSAVHVLPVTLTDEAGDPVPGFALMVSTETSDDDLAAVSTLELSRALGPSATTLMDCVSRSDAAFTTTVAFFAPVWLGAEYPGASGKRSSKPLVDQDLNRSEADG